MQVEPVRQGRRANGRQRGPAAGTLRLPGRQPDATHRGFPPWWGLV